VHAAAQGGRHERRQEGQVNSRAQRQCMCSARPAPLRSERPVRLAAGPGACPGSSGFCSPAACARWLR
jgi:hypothetical protein